MRVLDLSLLLPGPFCSRILADFGAEVIRVERPGGGDWLRYIPPLDPGSGTGLLFCALNRGKKSLTLNLKSEEGQEILLRLASNADVLLESFRPGVMERLRLGYETLAEINPHLVYCSLTGYGPTGPYQGRAGHDLNYAGLAGCLDLTGPQDGPPVVSGIPLADLTGALWSAVGILQALLDRERTGRGQRVDGSLLGAALACLPHAVAHHAGGQPLARGTGDLSGGRVCYNIYETLDGGYMTLAALEPQFWAAFCGAVGREDLLGQQLTPAVPGEPAFEALRALFRSRTQAEWAEVLAGVDACCEPVYSVGQALASAPVQALGMLAGEGLLPPVRLSASQERSRGTVPALGGDAVSLLAELGYDSTSVERLQGQGII